MTNSPGTNRELLSGRLKFLIAGVAVVIGLTVLVIWLLIGFGVYKLRGEVEVFGGTFLYPDTLVLGTGGPCQGDQEVSLLRETDVEVQVKVVASSRPFFQGGPECGGGVVEVQLSEPLGDRIVIDMHTGQRVGVAEGRPSGRQDQSQESGTEKSLAHEPRAVDTRNEGGLRHEIAVEVAWLSAPDTLVINANTCHRNPELSLFRETDVDVTVEMVVDPDPYPNGGPECLEELIVQLEKPLGDRPVTDAHTGKVLSVTPVAGTSTSASQQEEAESQPTEAVPQAIRDAVSDAELQDLQAVAEQYGMTLQEAFDRYAWNDNFSRAVQRIREAAPESFAGAEIVDATNAWIAFTGNPPKAALDIVDEFTRKHSSISVELRTGQKITEAELEEAVPAVHYAVYKSPGVLNASTSFDNETGEIVSVVVLENTAPDSVLDDLRAIAEQRLVEVMRPDILDSVSVSVVRSKSPVLSGTD